MSSARWWVCPCGSNDVPGGAARVVSHSSTAWQAAPAWWTGVSVESRVMTPARISPHAGTRHPVELWTRSEEHTSELQSRQYLVCRLLLEKKKKMQGQLVCG